MHQPAGIRSMRVAVACSGLGHVRRGIEAWAGDLAAGLHRAGVDVTLFGGAPGPGIVPLPCLRRTGAAALGLARGLRHLGGWRYGCGSPYEIEQTSFAWSLRRLTHHDYDILHVQDPGIAMLLEQAHRARRSRPAVVYANGTGEGADVMRRFAHLQLLTREAFDAWQPQRPPGQAVFCVPNFVDTGQFSPGDQDAARAAFDLPRGTMIVLCCAAIRRWHKRIDVLLRAFAAARAQSGQDAMLVIAGGREDDTPGLIAAGEALLGPRVRFLPDLPRERMAALYRAADLFTLPSLHEMFGIVLIEALASGLPVLCHDTPAFRGIVGPGGLFRDIAADDALAAALVEAFDPALRRTLAAAGRAHVEASYAEAPVIRDVLAMYAAVLAEPAHG